VWLKVARLLLWRMVMEAEGLVRMYCEVVVVALVVDVVVEVVCGGLLILLLGVVVGVWDVVLLL
jgi:hypothetical protein